jgi:hypothetical protein
MATRLYDSRRLNRRDFAGPACRMLLVANLAIAIAGCSRGPQRVEVPAFEPTQMTQEALDKNDANHDGSLDAAELSKWPGLRAAIPLIDANKNSKIDQEELTAHLANYQLSKIGLQSLTCIVTVAGKPLDGAVVEFHPEEFMQGILKSTRATTNNDGAGFVLPIEKGLPGIQPGIYRVTISKKSGDRELLPKRYNAETELGFVVSSASGGAPAQFKLDPR